MKPAPKLLIPLFIILLLLIVPVPVLIGASLLLSGMLYLPTIYLLLEQYRLVLVAAVLSVLLAYSLLKGYFGSHRSFYAAFGIVLLLLAFFLGYLQIPLYRFALAIAVIAALEAVYFLRVYDQTARSWYLLMCGPVLFILFAFPLYYIAFPGFAIFVASFAVRPGTRDLSVPEVNLKSMGVQTKSGQTRGGSKGAKTKPPRTRALPAPKPSRQNSAAEPPQEKKRGRIMDTILPASMPDDILPANVVWPSQSDYSRAMQNLGFSISATYPELKASKVMPNPYVKLPGNVVYSSGNYGTIFKLENSGSTHALKCFTRRKTDLNKRYFAIARALKSNAGSGLAFVDFDYMPKVIRTFKDPATFFPALRMEWVEGKTLNTFISEQLSKKDVLRGMAATFLQEMIKIRQAGIAHGDISGDNIVISSSGTMTLVDYDGMYIPEFSGSKAQELGHDNFQHPNRTAATYSERLDNFSILVTYLTLLAVAENSSLWSKYNKGDQDCLIFRKSDFTDPASSGVLRDIHKIKGKVSQLADLLEDALRHDPLWSGCDPQQIAKL